MILVFSKLYLDVKNNNVFVNLIGKLLVMLNILQKSIYSIVSRSRRTLKDSVLCERKKRNAFFKY